MIIDTETRYSYKQQPEIFNGSFPDDFFMIDLVYAVLDLKKKEDLNLIDAVGCVSGYQAVLKLTNKSFQDGERFLVIHDCEWYFQYENKNNYEKVEYIENMLDGSFEPDNIYLPFSKEVEKVVKFLNENFNPGRE